MATLVGAALVVVAIALAACGSPVPPAGPSGPGAPDASNGAPGTVDPGNAPGPGLAFPPDTLVGCDEAMPFPAAALGGPAGAEAGGDPAAAALRAFLLGPEGVGRYPMVGWRRVAEQPEANALFVALGDARTPWLQVVVERAADGTWGVNAHGQCHLTVLFQEDATTATWWLDPAFPAPEPGATTVHALVHERACASGRTAEGRILEPVIVSRPDAVVVAIGVRRRPGDQECPGNPPTPFVFELPVPLAGRPLLDGGPVPPRDARQPPGG